MEKLKSQVNVTFWFWLMYPPPPGMEKLKSQVNLTFWFWLMCPTPHPRNQNLTKHECYRTKSFQERLSSTFYNLPPSFPVPLSDSLPEQETGEFQFIWIYGLKPHLPPLSSQKNEMLIFGLHSTSDDQLGWSMDSNPICHPSPAKKKNEMLIFGLCSTSDDWPGWFMDLNPIHHPSPAKKMKCSFLDYIQLLMIGRAG